MMKIGHRAVTALLAGAALLLTLPVAGLTPPAPEPKFQRLFTDDRSDSSDLGAVRVLAQDAAGFIWLGAEYALARLDANGAKVYPVDDFDPRALSSGYIHDLLSDSRGGFWVATDSGLHRYDRERDQFARIMLDHHPRARVVGIGELPNGDLIATLQTQAVRFNREGKILARYPYLHDAGADSTSIGKLLVDSRGRVWIATLGHGVARLDVTTGHFQYFTHTPSDPASIASDQIMAIAEDPRGQLWFGLKSDGISVLDAAESGFTHFRHDPTVPTSLPGDFVWGLHFDARGELWVAIDQGGLAHARGPDWSFSAYKSRAFDVSSLSSDQVRSILEDRRGDLWIGAFPTGLNYLRRRETPIYHYVHQPGDSSSISHNGILRVREDRLGNAWVGTESGLNRIDAGDGSIRQWSRRDGLATNAVVSLGEAANGDIWFGTWLGGLHRLPAAAGPLRVYRHEANRPASLTHNTVWGIAFDRRGRLWLGTEGGGIDRFDAETESFTHFTHIPADPSSLDSNHVWTLISGRDGELWAGTNVGLNRIDPDTGAVRRFGLGGRPGRPQEEARVRAVMQDSRGDIWAGTQENGFFRLNPTSGHSAHYSTGAGLPSAYVSGFAEDHDGYIWATTTRGVVKIDPATMAMQVFTRAHGLAGAHFNREAIHVDRAGLLYLGSTEGLSVLEPRALQPDGLQFAAVITELSIMNRPAAAGGPNATLPTAPWATTELALDHTQPVFGFKFAALDYRHFGQYRYRYRLDGFDSEWQPASGNSASYTNLKPGQYRFRVQAGTQEGFSTQEASLTVTVAPAPWASSRAYAIYAVLAAALGVLIYSLIRRHYAYNSARQINAELIKLNEIKDAFLANTSHELRTPLNGIIGIAENLASQFSADPDAHHRLGLIATSGKRLASLINDILDYSKLAKLNLSLRVESVDLFELVEQVFALLAPLAADKPVRLINELQAEGNLVAADANRVQQILINLVGNGIKYTHNGEVRVSAVNVDEMLEIAVSDTGIGIETDQLGAIFEAFQQLQKSDARQYGGTGLGLAITRQLVELHGGRIWVDPDYRGGARLKFSLPKAGAGAAAPTAEPPPPPIIAGAPAPAPRSLKAVPASTPPPAGDEMLLPAPRNARHQTILVVDDDPINRLVLAGVLALHNYRVIEASSGKEALNLLGLSSPPDSSCPVDLMILDVMMPELGGFETCQQVRTRFPMHELPVLFLTAKRNVDEDLATCFRAGGNDFLTKPVSKYDLLPRVANHLRIAEIVRRLTVDLHEARTTGAANAAASVQRG